MSWGIETPLLIGKEEGNAVVPMTIGKPGEKRYVIPGATLRGLVRSSLEIIAFARLRQVNKHFRFGVRDFTHALYRDEEESPVSDDSQMRAGWLSKVGNAYRITPCADDGDRWGYVPIDSLRDSTGDQIDRAIWSGMNRQDKLAKMGVSRSGFRATSGRPLPDGRVGRMVYVPDASADTLGDLVVSGRAVGAKRYEYVLFGEAGARPEPVSPEAWKQFEIMNCRQGRRRLEPEGAWKELEPKVTNGGSIPVFWVGDLRDQKQKFAFGLTRLFKIPHTYSVGDKVPPPLQAKLAGNRPEIDFVENLFGYVYERQDLEELKYPDNVPNAVAHKGRIAFGFAQPVDPAAFTPWPHHAAQSTIMMAPRASYAPYYLTGDEKDWSSKDAKLAGRKRYPPRYRADKLDAAKSELLERLKDPIERLQAQGGRAQSGQVRSHLRFLEPTTTDAAFEGTIKLHNVSEVELGAALWALTFGGDPHGLYRHMLGRAKGMGAGQAAVRKIAIDWRPNWAGRINEEWSIGESTALATRCMQVFEKHMETATDNQWRRSESIRAYLRLHCPGTWTSHVGHLQAAMATPLSDVADRVLKRFESDGPLATNFLQRPNEPADKRNDFQRIRNVTKRAFKGWAPPEPAIPDRLLTIPEEKPTAGELPPSN